ncbi:hypothetical protein DAQ1742_00849 [Dickeya aquatica]|uniref:Uncharacterized protein n=1 Tax=Dickeya aquatica TaxID=1401087 RepID=A0A375A7A3_9GAMM|nr:hypothetical protein DAQ1742_00849 [Dickeya aquatica]
MFSRCAVFGLPAPPIACFFIFLLASVFYQNGQNFSGHL